MNSVVICPVCGHEYPEGLPDVREGGLYETFWDCEHLLWDTFKTPMGGDNFLTFLNDFLRSQKNDKRIGVLEFHRLDLDAIPGRALEANRPQLEALVNKRLHEVDGWYFGTPGQIQKLCPELVGKLKELV